jgi:hypothetical protein
MPFLSGVQKAKGLSLNRYDGWPTNGLDGSAQPMNTANDDDAMTARPWTHKRPLVGMATAGAGPT